MYRVTEQLRPVARFGLSAEALAAGATIEVVSLLGQWLDGTFEVLIRHPLFAPGGDAVLPVVAARIGLGDDGRLLITWDVEVDAEEEEE